MGNKKFKPAKVGDWVYCNGDCFGILMHIFTKRYAPYDEVPEDSVVGDVEYRIGQYKIFAKNDGTIYKRNRVKFDDCCLDQITEKDKIRLNKIIEQNQSEYQKFMSIEKEVYSMKEYTYHLPEGYTIDDMTKLFDSYRKELPKRFTFSDLRELCKKKESPIILDNYVRYGYQHYPQFSLVLYYPIEDFEGEDILYDSLKVWS